MEKGTKTEKTKSGKIVLPPESSFMYIAVKGSLHAAYCSVFGLNVDENSALLERYPRENSDLLNGICVKGHIMHIINSLSELGYRVIATCGENETTWTMQREI